MKYVVIDTLCHAFGKIANTIQEAMEIRRLMRMYVDRNTGYCSAFGEKGNNSFKVFEYDEVEAKSRTIEDIDELVEERDKELKELEDAYNVAVEKVWEKYYPLICGTILEHCDFSYGDRMKVVYKRGNRKYSYEGRCMGAYHRDAIKPYVVGDDRFYADYDFILSWEVIGTELKECEGKTYGANCHQCPYGCEAKYSKVQSSNSNN